VTPFRVDRSRRGEDRFLGQKMLLFVLAAVAGLAGMATDTGWLVYLAIALLIGGLVLRTLDSRHRAAAAADDARRRNHDDAGDAGDAGSDDVAQDDDAQSSGRFS
jgi:hypothetical protein